MRQAWQVFEQWEAGRTVVSTVLACSIVFTVLAVFGLSGRVQP